MIKTIIDKLLGKATAASKTKNPFGKREEVGVDVHNIDPKLVDRRALDVCSTLKEAGFEAYIVGGAVRDLLLGLRPKDFDVATNATPEQVKGLFRRAFIIGKRFRIVHVVYGRGRENEVIEVSTFRAFLDNSAAEAVAGRSATDTAALERREDHLTNAPIDRDRSQDALALGYGFNAGGHTLQLNVRHDSDSEFGGKGTGSVAYGYAITPTLRATASAGTAFRAPTLYQRFSAYGDPSLTPETGRNIELGLRYASGATHASVVAYRNRVTNLIVFDSGSTACGQSFGCYNSIGRAEYKGVTLAADHRIAGVTLRGSIDFQNPKDLTTGKALQRRAKRHASFGADTVLAGWTLGGEVQASGQRFENAANTQVLGGYTLVNLYASTRIARDFTLLARVDNLGDKDYQVARTYVTPGRTLYVGLKWAPQR